MTAYSLQVYTALCERFGVEPSPDDGASHCISQMTDILRSRNGKHKTQWTEEITCFSGKELREEFNEYFGSDVKNGDGATVFRHMLDVLKMC